MEDADIVGVVVVVVSSLSFLVPFGARGGW